jgi:hypothetical protein
VERNLVEPRNRAQPRDIVDDDRMIRAEHRAERMGARLGPGDAVLVEIVAENVDAIGAGQVVEHIAVEVRHRDAGRRLHESAGAEMFADQPAILERHPVGFGELQVGDSLRGFLRHLAAAGEHILVELRQPEEAVLALHRHRGRRAIGAEEIVDVEFVERDQPRHHARHLRMPGERAVLGARQRQPRLHFGETGCDGGRRGGSERKNRERRIHATSANQSC